MAALKHTLPAPLGVVHAELAGVPCSEGGVAAPRASRSACVPWMDRYHEDVAVCRA